MGSITSNKNIQSVIEKINSIESYDDYNFVSEVSSSKKIIRRQDDSKYNISVLDLGAAPGSWSQYAAKVAKSGRLISIDLKKMEPIGNTLQIHGDFTEQEIQNEIKKHINNKVDVVMSDMAVNTTGIKNIDSIQTGELCIEAMVFAKDILEANGFFISKIFMGGTFNEIVAEGKKYFKEVKVFKPKSSRKDSKESFIICRKLR